MLYHVLNLIDRGNLVLKQSHFLFSTEFWRHAVLSCGIQRLTLRSEKYKILHFFEWESNPQPVTLTVTLCNSAPPLTLVELASSFY